MTIAYGHALTIFSTGAWASHGEVVAYHFDILKHVGTVPNEVALPQGSCDFTIFDEIGLCHAKDEVTCSGVDLAATELRDINAVLCIGNNVLGFDIAVRYICVGHPDHGEMLVTLPSAVS